MDRPSLLPPQWKIYRAGCHFKELETELHRYFEGNPGKLVVEPESTADSVLATFKAKTNTPARIPIIIGDCLQNTRSALDYLVWELVRANGHDPGKHNMFPVCPSQDAFKNALEWHGKRPGALEGVHPDAVAEIAGLQPYTVGNDWEQQSTLWALDYLTNVNKHRRVLLTDMKAAPMGEDIEIVDINGELWWHGNMPSADENTKLGPFPVSGGEVKMDQKILAFIAFNEAPVAGKEVTTFLNGVMRFVHLHVLPKFERFFPV